MISKTNISITLAHLNSRYNRSTSSKESLLVSKSALLELCGWIEESVDDIVLIAAKRVIKDASNRRSLKNDIKKIHGFSYEDHFRRALRISIGWAGLELLEKNIDQVSREHLESKFGTLTLQRNKLAHTHMSQRIGQIPAPSQTLNDFQIIYPCLKIYESNIRLIKFGFDR